MRLNTASNTPAVPVGLKSASLTDDGEMVTTEALSSTISRSAVVSVLWAARPPWRLMLPANALSVTLPRLTVTDSAAKSGSLRLVAVNVTVACCTVLPASPVSLILGWARSAWRMLTPVPVALTVKSGVLPPGSLAWVSVA